VAVAGRVIYGQHGKNMILRGDSITVLTWAITEHSRGAIVTKAAMIWTQLCVATDTHISEVQHIAGSENHLCDNLSRRSPSDPRSIHQHAIDLGIHGASCIDIQEDADVMALINLCNPSAALVSENLFTEFWGTVRTHIDSLLSRHPCTEPLQIVI
jgi:hypothetical protein